jgi:hypothetical protein
MPAFLTRAARKVFHQLFQDWACQASNMECDLLDAALEKYQTGEIRSMVTFIRDGMADPIRQLDLPTSLVERLQVLNWPQGFFGDVDASSVPKTILHRGGQAA